MPGWWELYPDRWRRELEALTAAGWTWQLEDVQDGLIGLQLRAPLSTITAATNGKANATTDGATPVASDSATDGGEDLVLRVLFPPAYPFFPAHVYDEADTLGLDRHREPHQGVLCLVDDRDWDVTSTLADLLTVQLPRLIAAATSTRTASEIDPGLETPTPEPVGRYVITDSTARILIDTDWPIPAEAERGLLVTRFIPMLDHSLGPGIVSTLHYTGTNLETWPDRLLSQFPLHVPGRWTRCPDFDPLVEPAVLWERLDAALPPLRHVEAGTGTELDPQLPFAMIGLLVPSETRYRSPGEEWVFLVRTQHPDGEPQNGYRHSQPAGPGDYAARTPATAGCRDRQVLLVGIGAIGSTVATELARAGLGTLDLLDGDLTDAATACRQIAPATWSGFAKVDVLRQVLAEHTPHTQVHAHAVQLGSVQHTHGGMPDAHQAVAHLVSHADLVIDTAAAPAVSRYLAALCIATGTSLLHASATAGAWGGLVAEFPATGAACWWCMLHHRADHTLPVPPAAADPLGQVTPHGCQTPTFTGTSADLATIATHAARMAVEHLAAPGQTSSRGQRRPPPARLHVAALRNSRGAPIPVRWTTRRLAVHPACPIVGVHPAPDIPPSDNRGATRPGAPPPRETETSDVRR